LRISRKMRNQLALMDIQTAPFSSAALLATHHDSPKLAGNSHATRGCLRSLLLSTHGPAALASGSSDAPKLLRLGRPLSRAAQRIVGFIQRAARIAFPSDVAEMLSYHEF
jgi:hypothetical protein